MKNKFTILLFILVSILASFSYANQNINQQQLSDKKRAEEYQNKATSIKQERKYEKISHKYAVFIWDRDTGYWYGEPEILVKPKYNSEKEAVQIMKKEFVRVFKEEDGIDVKATDYLVWDGRTSAIVVMGKNRKTEEWEAFSKSGVSDENKEILINECKKNCRSCQVIWKN